MKAETKVKIGLATAIISIAFLMMDFFSYLSSAKGIFYFLHTSIPAFTIPAFYIIFLIKKRHRLAITLFIIWISVWLISFFLIHTVGGAQSYEYPSWLQELSQYSDWIPFRWPVFLLSASMYCFPYLVRFGFSDTFGFVFNGISGVINFLLLWIGIDGIKQINDRLNKPKQLNQDNAKN